MRKSYNCQLEMDIDSLAINDYNDIARIYDETMGEDFLKAIFEPTCKSILQTLGSKKQIRHLDLACGTGLFLCKLRNQAKTEPFGIDKSSEQIACADSRLKGLGIPADLRIGDMLELEFPGECNLITMNFDSLNHVQLPKDWARLFSKIYRSLTSPGLLLFDVNTPRRLISDWNYPEVIIKPNLTYVQCGLEAERYEDHVRRKLLMQIFVSCGITTAYSALLEQTAVPTAGLIKMLRTSGFSAAKIRPMKLTQKARHIFLKHRVFVMAVK